MNCALWLGLLFAFSLFRILLSFPFDRSLRTAGGDGPAGVGVEGRDGLGRVHRRPRGPTPLCALHSQPSMPLPGSEALGQGAAAAVRPLQSPCAPPELVWAVGHVLGARASPPRALSLDCRLLESPGSFNKATCQPPPSETWINKPL